jgi:hypothetical protein
MSQLQSIGALSVTTANSRSRDLLGYAGIPGKPSTQTGFRALSESSARVETSRLRAPVKGC